MTRIQPTTEDRDGLLLGAARVQYRLTRGARRTLEISVSKGVIEVRAPLDLAREHIERRLKARRRWIRQQLVDQELARPEAVPRTYRAGETYRYLGRQYRLTLQSGTRAQVSLAQGRLRVAVTDTANEGSVRRALGRWYRARAKVILPERMSHLLALPALQGLRPNAIRIQRMTTRWGSCSHSGRILLNADLIRLPMTLIDYVIAHELCHLRVQDHGVHFQRALSRVMPDWRDRRRRLATVRLD